MWIFIHLAKVDKKVAGYEFRGTSFALRQAQCKKLIFALRQAQRKKLKLIFEVEVDF
jgi:hypothetical protein